jgi:hypothetical protein
MPRTHIATASVTLLALIAAGGLYGAAIIPAWAVYAALVVGLAALVPVVAAYDERRHPQR